MAREHVIVSLSGDGGDELFAGYTRYLMGHALWHRIKGLPDWLRKMTANGIRCIQPKTWDQVSRLLPAKLRPSLLGDKAYKFANIMTMSSNQDFYQSLVTHWDKPEDVVLGGVENALYPWKGTDISFDNFIEEMQFLDTLTYLPDDILTKVDRASMAVSLEGRVPLLDHRVVEFAWQLPLNMKIREGKGKWLLRKVLDKYVPREFIERPKMGFGVPIDQWLRGPLRDWAEELLAADLLREQGLLNPDIIRQRWTEHLSGQRNWQYSLWGVLMFQAWFKNWYKR